MRTRTNVYFGAELDRAIEALGRLFPAGKVKVFFDDEAEGEIVAEGLTEAGYRVEIADATRGIVPTEDFCLGAGGEGALLAASASARGKYAFFPRALLPELFCKNAYGRFAEFAYFDTDVFCCDNPLAVAECYSGLLCAGTEALAALYSDADRPFGDRALRNIVLRAKSILLGGSDRETFVSDCVRTTAEISEALSDRGVSGYTATDMARYLGGGVGRRDLSAYFLNRLLILFTKWNFRDMLIPSEGASVGPTAYRKEDLILSGEDLGRIAAVIKNDVEKPNLTTLVAAMKSAVAGKKNLFSEMFLRGLPEGLVGYG
ncbi:MAG: hypothetical protein IJ735_07095 [Clostridia bacterium]|nr:hypothetical protein [Clostridia bacterium]